ncbi:MAG: hypothetical protein J3K34DRAFT_368355 [Monoraphidium minutum]|nr:MAG: hypothetical protein J3K34DRAFT_368355 [Monoraphidium minutum]
MLSSAGGTRAGAAARRARAPPAGGRGCSSRPLSAPGAPQQQQQARRDVGARVFGTWRTPPLADAVDLRRLLAAAPRAGAALLPRPPPPAQQGGAARSRAQLQQAAEQQLVRQLEELKQQREAADAAAGAAAAAAAAPKPLRLSWAGSGVYFWWQLGAMQWLAQRYDLTRVPMAGASGGAICAVLARCGVDAADAAESAYQMAVDNKIWGKPLGLVGSWGGLIEQWMHDLLPADAAERCRGDLGVVVTEVPAWRQLAIDDFRDKEDLVNCVMASAHVPLLLDRQLTRPCRGSQYVDGSFPDFFTGVNCDHLQRGGDAVVFDYFDDANIIRQGRMDMLTLKRYSELRRIVLLGGRYAARLEGEGAFERFHLEPVRKAGLSCR